MAFKNRKGNENKGKGGSKGKKEDRRGDGKTFTNVAALWRTRNGSSKVIASGTLQPDGQDGESFDVLLMKNDKGDNDKRPDFRLVIVEEDDDNEGDVKSDKDNDQVPF